MAVPMMGAIQGLAGIAGGLIGGGKRKREQREAQKEHDRLKARMEGADTSNLYKNMENVYEDLTINTQAADMQNQANQASLSNTMAGLQGSAGGSGIAALAQSLAGQQAQMNQSAVSDIARQEAGNQAAERQTAGSLQQQEVQGDYQARAAEKDKVDTMFGMSQQRLAAANAAQDAATSSIIGGVTGLAGSVVPQLPGMKEKAGGTNSPGGFLGNLLGG